MRQYRHAGMLVQMRRALVQLMVVGLVALAAAAVAPAAWAEPVSQPITSWAWPADTMVYDPSAQQLTLASAQEVTRQQDWLADTQSNASLVASPDGTVVWRLQGSTARALPSGAAVDLSSVCGSSGVEPRAVATQDGRMWAVCGSRIVTAAPTGLAQQVSTQSVAIVPLFGFVARQAPYVYGLGRGDANTPCAASQPYYLCWVEYNTSASPLAVNAQETVNLQGLLGNSGISAVTVFNGDAYFLNPGFGFVRVWLSGPNQYAWLSFDRNRSPRWARWQPDFDPNARTIRAIFFGGSSVWVVADTELRVMSANGMLTQRILTYPSGLQARAAAAGASSLAWVTTDRGTTLLYRTTAGQEALVGQSTVLPVDVMVSNLVPFNTGADFTMLIAPVPCASGSGRCVVQAGSTPRYASAGVAAVSPVFTGLVMTGPLVYKVLDQLVADVTQPPGTEIRWALSFDRGATWQVYQSGAWQALSGLSALATAGMPTSTLAALSRASLGSWADRPFQVAVALVANADRSAAPGLRALRAEFGLYEAPTASGLSCPPETAFGVAVTCTVTATAPLGTVQYAWTVTPSATVVAGSGQTVTLTPRRVEPVSVTLAVSLQEDPTRTAAPLTATIAVTPPVVRLALACPADRVGRRQELVCDAILTGSTGSPQVRWNVGDGVGQTENGGLRLKVRWPTLGQKSVSAVAALAEAPEYTATASAPVEVVGWQKPSLRITGPAKIVRGTVAAFQGVAALPKGAFPGTVEIRWDVLGQSSAGPVLNLSGERVGKLLVTAKAVIVEANGDPDAESDPAQLELTVTPRPKPQVTLRGPRFAVEGFPLTIEAKVKSPSPVTLEWTLPDGSRQTGLTRLTYTPQAGGSVQVVQVRAIPGADAIEDEIGSASLSYPVLTYTFPTFVLERRGDRDPSVPYTVAFKLTGNVKDAPGAVFTYAWDFGDGTTLTGAKSGVTHVYRAPGTYRLSVTVSDQAGHRQTLTDEVVAEPAQPIKIALAVTPSNKFLKAPLTLKVRPTVTGLKGDKITTYEWRLNGVVVSRAPLGVFTLPEPGEAQLSLRVGTQQQQTAEASLPVTVTANQPPTCSVSQQASLFRAKQIRLAAACLDTDGRIKGYRWDLGDGRVVENRAIVVATYDEPGTYHVTLTATDDNGATAEVSETVMIN